MTINLGGYVLKERDKWMMGLPYIGSKQAIAQKIVDVLPAGHRIIDVFGGGGAMTLAMANSGKWDQVRYNEVRPGVVNLFQETVQGTLEFDWPRFAVPNREAFFKAYQLNSADPYDMLKRLIWSFGYDGRTFLYGQSREADMIASLEGLMTGKSGTFWDQSYKYTRYGTDIASKQGLFRTWFREHYDGKEMPYSTAAILHLETLTRLHRIQRIYEANFPCLQQISFTNYDYRELDIQPDDIVYLDPPYINTEHRYGGFDFDAFQTWYQQLPNQHVYLSEYTVLPGTEVVADWQRVNSFRQHIKYNQELLLKVKN